MENVDKNIQDIIAKYPLGNKQEVIEKLIVENPEHKDQILSIVTKTLDQQLTI
jgi:hypothetical protein